MKKCMISIKQHSVNHAFVNRMMHSKAVISALGDPWYLGASHK